MINRIAAFCALAILLLSFASCDKKASYRFEEGIAWNTLYHITYQSDRDLSDSIRIILSEIDNSLSPFNENSVVFKINSNRSDTADTHFNKVYSESIRINKATEGAFDPTLGPVIRAWGFGKGHEVSADTLKLDSLLQLVGIGKTELAGKRLIKKDPGIEFNFSALAKGYGVDCIADMLKRNNVANFLVEVGGEIRTSGVNPDGKKWSIGIDRPDSEVPTGETVLNIRIDNAGIATSGNYRNYQTGGGRKFGHTISPETGRPVETDVISATVIAPTCMEADALATCCMVLGCDKAIELCNSLNAGVMLIRPDMTVVSNELFDSRTKD